MSQGSKHVSNYRRKIKKVAVDLHGGCCRVCGYSKCIRSLHFHHVDPKEKSFTLASYVAVAKKDFFLECRKCVLLCSNCHMELEDGLIECPPILEEVLKKIDATILEIDLSKDKRRICIACKKEFYTSRANKKLCSSKCASFSRRKVKRPTKKELEDLIRSKIPLTKIGKKYGVSDNAVRKWIKVIDRECEG